MQFPYKEWHQNDFTIHTDVKRMDVEAIHRMISSAYWAKGRSLQTVKETLEHSLCFGLFQREKQIGFARVITDQTTFAYLCDVIIAEEYRGQGLGKWFMDCIMDHPVLRKGMPMLLATLDAHGLYAKYGFKPLPHPEHYMKKEGKKRGRGRLE